MEQDILNDYQQRVTAANLQADKYKKLVNTYSFMRLGVIGLILIFVYIGSIESNFNIIAISFLMLLFCFIWLVSKQSGFEKQKKYYEDLVKIAQNEINSITTHGNLYSNGVGYSNDKHFYIADLDIFGNASLYQLINRSATASGGNKLAEWLNAPAEKPTILSRQAAVKELFSKNTWKLDIQAKLLFAIKENAEEMRRLFIYLKTPLVLSVEGWINIYVKLVPWLLTASIIAAFFIQPIAYVAIAITLFNFLLLYVKSEYMMKAGSVADKIDNVLANYAIVFNTIETEQWQSPLCNELTTVLKNGDTSKKIKELSALINNLSAGSILILGFILNIFFLWSLKYIIAIERWKRNNHQNFETAFNVIAEFEALISLSSLAINYPNWVFPQIADGEGYTISAKNIAHPLIIKNSVANNYQLYDTFKIDIITGSNMAGKSTFLRTIGINTVLALCGAPVCADSMAVSVITMVTYMRIKDSLNESTSTFKAELDRLQMLLAAVENEPTVFFLIDEMLRGTNSVDKYLGSKAVIEQLISKKGVGMVATHDLQIARLEQKHPDYVRNFYFDIQVLNGEMVFDYKMKHGECKTFNASLLLKQIGIDVEAE
jgi:hypothetical protein